MDSVQTPRKEEKKSLLQYSELRGAIEALNSYSDGLPDKLNAIKLNIAKHLEINSDVDVKEAKRFLSSINSNTKVIKSRRLDVTRFLDEAKKRFTTREKELANPFNEFAAQVEAAIEDFKRRERERKAAEEAELEAKRKAAEEAAEWARKQAEAKAKAQADAAAQAAVQDAEDTEEEKEAQRLAAEEAKKADREARKAEIFAQQAARIEANKVAENTRKARQDALKSTKKDAFTDYEITDFSKIPADLISVSFNFLPIRAYLKEHGSVPGLKVTAKNGQIFE